MKKSSVLFFVSITMMINLIFADNYITRGPAIGEIYFIGPTYSGLALYRSIDFGQSIICMDSINSGNMMAITADKTQGIIYYTTMQGSLYFSDNYGIPNSWIFRHSGIGIPLCNSENIGFVFEHAASHSEDFGYNFITHSGNGAFGLFKEAEKGFGDDGYFMSYKDDVQDSLYLFLTMDNFNNLEIINVFNFQWNNQIELTRGNTFGEIYLSNLSSKKIFYSSDFGLNFINTNQFNLENDYSLEIIGGRQSGELYLMYNFVSMGWQNAHIYIFHSIDYGITFEVFHPFAKGEELLLANFSATEKEVPITSSVDFSNFSIGDIQEYQWDFDNDGIIDSYDRIPVYTYADTGWYSVKLTIVGADSSNSFVKQDYIHVIDTTTDINEMQLNEFAIAPNPFMDQLTLTSNFRNESYSVFIY
jgi:PKD repeat protein